MIYKIKAILLNIAKYVREQLANTPAYVQAMRDCYFTLWDVENKCLKPAYNTALTDLRAEWTYCIGKKLKSVHENISAQKEFRYAKLLELCATNEEIKELAEHADNSIFYIVYVGSI
jgi:hypothetical protein